MSAAAPIFQYCTASPNTREAAKNPPQLFLNFPSKDYSIKEGEKISVKIKGVGELYWL